MGGLELLGGCLLVDDWRLLIAVFVSNVRFRAQQILTISRIPLDFAALANAFSPSGLIIFASPVGQINKGTLTGRPSTELEVSTSATSLITRGRNHIRLYIDPFMSRLQQSVAAVE